MHPVDTALKPVLTGRGCWLVLSCSPVSPCCPVDSRLRGNDGKWLFCLVVTLCSQCQALGQALVLCRQGRGDSVGIDLFTRATLPSCGLRIKSAMTCVAHPCEFPVLWMLGQVQYDGGVNLHGCV